MRDGLYKFCISTIADRTSLEPLAARGDGELFERKPWKTGKELFNDACGIGARMPVIFSDAAHDCETLLYWAVLRGIDSDEKGTWFRFDDIKRIGRHRRQELVLMNAGRKIRPHFIRPYAICHTPDWLE